MPLALAEVPQTVVSLLTHAVGAFVLLVIFVILRYIFELQFTCSCTTGIHPLDIMYMVFPPLVVYLLIYVMSQKYQRLFCCCCSSYFRSSQVNSSDSSTCPSCMSCCYRCCNFTYQQILQFLLIAFLWIDAVFIDGDWFVCYMWKQNETLVNACIKTENRTHDELMLVNKWMETSKIIGLCMTMGAALILVVWSCVVIKGRCCEPYFKKLYDDLLKQQTDQNLTEALTEIANERCQAIIRDHIETIRETEMPSLQSPGGNDASSKVEQAWNSVSELFFCHTKAKGGKCISSSETIESMPRGTQTSETEINRVCECATGQVEKVAFRGAESNSETNQYESDDTVETTAPNNEVGASGVTEHDEEPRRQESHSSQITTNVDIHEMADRQSETFNSDSHSRDHSEENKGSPAQSDPVAHSSQSDQALQSKWSDQAMQFPEENQATHGTQSEPAICPILSEEDQAPQPAGDNQVMQTSEDDLPESEGETTPL